MPFNYVEYSQECSAMSEAALQKEWQNYTRQIAGAATSTTLSILFSPFTLGVSLIGLGFSCPRIHNARKKRAIIDIYLKAHESKHVTRIGDVVLPMALSGTIGGLTMGLAGPGGEMIQAVGEEAFSAIVSQGAGSAAAHVALDGAGAAVEHKHSKHKQKHAQKKHVKQEAKKLKLFQKWKADEEAKLAAQKAAEESDTEDDENDEDFQEYLKFLRAKKLQS